MTAMACQGDLQGIAATIPPSKMDQEIRVSHAPTPGEPRSHHGIAPIRYKLTGNKAKNMATAAPIQRAVLPSGGRGRALDSVRLRRRCMDVQRPCSISPWQDGALDRRGGWTSAGAGAGFLSPRFAWPASAGKYCAPRRAQNLPCVRRVCAGSHGADPTASKPGTK